jgi:hypothetical protein
VLAGQGLDRPLGEEEGGGGGSPINPSQLRSPFVSSRPSVILRNGPAGALAIDKIGTAYYAG